MFRRVRFMLASACLSALLSATSMIPLMLLPGGAAWAQGTGRSLDIPPGARQNGMGTAGVALIGDASDAVWWNPAALGFARTVSAQLTHTELLPGFYRDGPNFYNGAAGCPLRSFGGIGLAVTHMSYDENTSELSSAASAGWRVLPGFSVGATLKWIRIQLAPEAQSGVARTVGVDLGALYRMSSEPMRLSLGANLQNLGPEVSFINEDQSSSLSRNLKVGGAIELPIRLGDGYEAGGIGVLDYNQSLVTREFHTWNGGVEAYAGYLNYVRLAVRTGYYYDDLGDIRDWTFGLGARIAGATVDVAWIPQARNSNLDRVMKLTGGFHFDLFGDPTDATSQ